MRGRERANAESGEWRIKGEENRNLEEVWRDRGVFTKDIVFVESVDGKRKGRSDQSNNYTKKNIGST